MEQGTKERANGSSPAFQLLPTNTSGPIVDTPIQRIVREDSAAIAKRRWAIMELGILALVVLIILGMLCLNLFARIKYHFERRRRISRARACSADERSNVIARSLIIKHVLRKQKREPQELDYVCGVGRGRTRNKKMIADHELLSEQEDRAVMPRRPSSASVPDRRIQRLKSDLVISDDAEDSEVMMDSTRHPWMCAICLIPYKVGDEICWTRNPACIHVFHHVCIGQWLQTHHDCPVCRASYIFVVNHDRPWSTLQNTLQNRFLNSGHSSRPIEAIASTQDNGLSSRLEEGGLTDQVLDPTEGDSRPIVDEPLSSDTN